MVLIRGQHLLKPVGYVIVGFRFENEYENQLKVFARVFTKGHSGKLHFTFFFSAKKLVLLFILKEFKPSSRSKMIKLLTFDNLLPPLRHSR